MSTEIVEMRQEEKGSNTGKELPELAIFNIQ
jgi:hypothetical protein